MLIYKLIIEHYTNLQDGFRTIVKLNAITKQQYQHKLKNGNKRFLLSTFLGVAIIIEAILNMIRTHRVDQHYFYSLTRIWPATEEQRNVISLGAYLIHPWFYISVFTEEWNHLDCLLYMETEDELSINYHDKPMPRVVTKKVINYHNRVKSLTSIFNVLILLGMHIVGSVPYFVAEIFFPNNESWSVRNTIYFIFTPVYMTYLAFTAIYMIRFWLNCHYVWILQNYYIDWLKKSTRVIMKRPHKMPSVYPRFNIQFKHIFEMLKDIGLLNRFWSKYISGALVVYCFEVCYMFFAMVSAKSLIERLQLLPLMAFAVSYFFYIYSISLNCSKIYQNNSTLHRYIRMFLIRVSRSKVLQQKNIHRIHAQHSFEQFFRNKGFRLINGLRINNRMFEFLFTTIAIISLKLFGKTLVEYF